MSAVAADEAAHDDASSTARERGEDGKRKRSVDEDNADDDDGDADGASSTGSSPAKAARKLTHSEEMQLRLLAALPSASGPMRDARGRRKSVCINSDEMVEAGLSALVGASAGIAAPPSHPRAGGGSN